MQAYNRPGKREREEQKRLPVPSVPAVPLIKSDRASCSGIGDTLQGVAECLSSS
jgi:hypothetical protein